MRIVIPLFPEFTALDVSGPYDVLAELGMEVVLVAQEPGLVRDAHGMLALNADAAFDEIDRADVLVVPGGYGTRKHAESPELVEWIKQIHETTLWTTSVCNGALFLAAAGLLAGLEATTHFSTVADLQAYGVRYTPRRVVTQGKIMTAAGVSSGIDMALTLAALLTDQASAEAVQLFIEYDPQPPFDSGSVAKASPGALAVARRRLGPDWEPFVEDAPSAMPCSLGATSS